MSRNKPASNSISFHKHTKDIVPIVVGGLNGHDMEVSAKYYLQVPEQLYKEVIQPNAPQTGTQTGTNLGNSELAQTRLSF